ncbi:MAG: 6-carboxytetrahydropterin synthase [Candidatus Zixiibacteriota bacterium]|nr:MAG: 6-carboxytetrahydropterin synthase [candidate division Zixibacteria bacterium]
MHLSISKRFEFSSSHRSFVRGWTEAQNQAFFGREALSPNGHGHNYVASFAFNGPVDPKTGMMINVVIIKEKIKEVIDNRYDHRYLNDDVPAFQDIVPTAENVTVSLLRDVVPLFNDVTAQPSVCHLAESPASEATAYAGGEVERHLWMNFSAARRTCSPHLTDAQNEELFGRAASTSGHGHHYRLRVTLQGQVDGVHGMIFPEREAREILSELHHQLDHRNLSTDVPQLRDMPMTTEMLSLYFFDYLKTRMPVSRVKLYENDEFFAEYLGSNRWFMAYTGEFHAAHRLHCRELTEAENLSVYGKCNNPRGHGHLYRVECSIEGSADRESGVLYKLDDLIRSINTQLDDWNYKHLDLDTSDFTDKTTTGENILMVLWSKLEVSLGNRLSRLRLWETPNNRFSLRRGIDDRT